MPDDLYERDILLWSKREAELLRRLSRGERVNDAVDWPHVIEELADVGLAELHAVESLLRQAMLHLLKLRAEPEAEVARHWQVEIIAFRSDARHRYVPSMRHRIDLSDLWHVAARQAAILYPSVRLPETCPWTLRELLAEDVDVRALVGRAG